MGVKAVFLDRDGVINSDVGHYYIYRVEDFNINPGVFQGLKLLTEQGFRLFVITNQGGVAKGTYSLDDVAKVHAYMLEKMRLAGIVIEDIFFCPHHDAIAPCDCRKPSPFMIEQAVSKYGLDPEKSFLIGDSPRDIQAGEAAGLKQCFKIEANASILPVCEEILRLEKEL